MVSGAGVVEHLPVAKPETVRPQGTGAARSVEPTRVPIEKQVRIEQRVIVRISPPGRIPRQSLIPPPAPQDARRLKERKIGKCVPLAGIAAVQPDAGGRLLLFMRDQRLLSASLEKACSARDFYSGFYIERSNDGMLCADRDKLHSRAGSNCSISRMRQLVDKDD
ncbi:hypothetical protein GCM10011515_14750 [Tsuneonella deserti]|uniref:Uncharacterized protein n=1 Tax=Tsuneonella deserti TaxID=2035528 RepID=A0ABQ1S9X9_9SPHN|nr:hypothetical protein GCM10011515_14750 [Tsuneonella deserti]